MAILALTALPSLVFAQGRGPSAADEEAAARESDRGRDLAREEKWCDAVGAFQKSYDLAPTPNKIVNIGIALDKCGRLMDAKNTFERYLETAPTGETASRVKSFLETLSQRIPQIRISTTGLLPDDKLALDGAAVDPAKVEQYLPVNPGEHTVTVERATGIAKRESFSVTEGEHRLVEIAVPPPCPDENHDNKCDTPCVDHDLDGKCDKDTCSDWDEEAQVCRDEAGSAAGGTDGGSIFDEPVFWIVAGVVVAAGLAIGTYLIIDGLSSDEKCASSDFGGCFKPSASSSALTNSSAGLGIRF
ncbi:MAG: hypothetical protein R3A78_06600 [Polyangiales bacterium]